MINLSTLGQLFSATRFHLQNKDRLPILVDVSFFTEILLLKVILVYFTLVISVL